MCQTRTQRWQLQPCKIPAELKKHAPISTIGHPVAAADDPIPNSPPPRTFGCRPGEHHGGVQGGRRAVERVEVEESPSVRAIT
jgi:hypothetical protein